MSIFTVERLREAIERSVDGPERWLLQAVLLQRTNQPLSSAGMAKLGNVDESIARFRIRLLAERGLIEPERDDCSTLDELDTAFRSANDPRLRPRARDTVEELRALGLVESCPAHIDGFRIPDERVADVITYLSSDAAGRDEIIRRWEAQL